MASHIINARFQRQPSQSEIQRKSRTVTDGRFNREITSAKPLKK
jgi:hypothetical protein